MSILLKVTTRTALDGRILGDAFSHSFLIRCSELPTPQALYDWAGLYQAKVAPLLIKRMEVYSTTIVPIEVPGRRRKVRNDHMTRYSELSGTAGADDVDPALLAVCAHFYKFPTLGTAGDFLIRGALNETMLQSTIEGEPDNIEGTLVNGADPNDARFQAFATGDDSLLALIGTLNSGKMVMPLRDRDDKGEVVTLAAYTDDAREVKKLEFAGFTARQVHKHVMTLEGTNSNLLRRYIAKLRAALLQATEEADGEALAPETIDRLYDMGTVIRTKFTLEERMRVNVEPGVAKYIKARA